MVFGSRVRDRVFWFGIEMNTMVMVLNLIHYLLFLCSYRVWDLRTVFS